MWQRQGDLQPNILALEYYDKRLVVQRPKNVSVVAQNTQHDTRGIR